MTAGFATLAELKQRLLPPSLQDKTTHDAAVLSLGKGVAAYLDRFCNRQFLRAVGGTTSFSGGRDHFYLPRFPIESISTIEQRETYSGGWTELALATTLTEVHESTGYVGFISPLGADSHFIRVTYTGGYWVDESEGGSGTLPSGATALPDDVKEAWYQTCEAAWAVRDKLGANLARPVEPNATLLKFELTPFARDILRGYTRYQMT